MIWKKLTIETTTEAVDMISYTLGELGVEGIEVEDKVPLSEEDKKAMFIDILPELPADDGIAYITCYIDDPKRDVDALVEDIKKEFEQLRQFMDIGSGHITLGETEDKDWMNNWKEFFHPFRLDNILIKPTWIDASQVELQPGELLVEIDPGTAFGTGSHETTKLCIAQLKKYLNGEPEVFDIGCGSGILSIIAVKLGAKQVFGVDIDPLAIDASYENTAVNHISETQVSFQQGDVIGDSGFTAGIEKQYDVVVANILADVIIPLSEKIIPFLKPDGVFISSGIIHTKEEPVRNALVQNGFEIIETTYMKDWVCFTARPAR
ncbi:MAG: 50S ribosomal protein L11 methyltransferase [Bacteroides sp.]|nr:50S ribosomal protein L11 methyltransferase [Bacteroides sp.]MCM1548628.1 50S ribosomal protein L11 methyltransferase [Clostridium sp.]